MKFGVTFPQTEIGPDPIALRDFAQVAEGAGFDYLADSPIGSCSQCPASPMAGCRC
jgi:hypothetical protein